MTRSNEFNSARLRTKPDLEASSGNVMAASSNGVSADREQVRPRISVVAIARNEEQDLPGFLENFLPLADEIVLVDDGSTDRTCEIAELAGPRVKLVRAPRREGEGFCHQRNKGIALATGDWLLHVDIDDRAPSAIAQEISRVVRVPSVDAYEFGFVHFFLNRRLRFGGAQSWRKPWLVRKGVADFEGIVHERLRLPPSATVRRLEWPMWHLGDDNFSERLRKNVVYSELEVIRLIERGARATLSGACWSGVKAFLRTYLLQRGFCDGRAGLFWALYVWSGTINRGLLAYDRLHPASRAELERQVREGVP
jgi:glycosyltransferase involved in cell wall biosynthesis